MGKIIRKLAAIMFADIVNYTAMVHKDEYDALTKRHRFEQSVRKYHEQYNGRIVQFLGDGTISIFQSALHAAQCAVGIQKELLMEPAIPMRIGLHSGEVLMEGENIFGDSVNIASRIESFAEGGSILLSEAVHQQIMNHPEIGFEDMGTFLLKNIKEPIRLFAVKVPGVVLPTHELLAGKGENIRLRQVINLPRHLTTLFGRQDTLEQVSELIRESAVVTLTGPGGSGKTRLAQSVAQNVVTDFRDGTYWVDLTNVGNPEQFPFTLGKSLSVIQDPNSEMISQVIEFLTDRHALLVLDNFEQIIEAAVYLEQILRACPRIKVLITSRTILQLMGEQEFLVQPLNLPKPGLDLSPEHLLEYNSIQLFCDRAKKVNPIFKLTSQNSAYVLDICRKLDGLPLAIELAAARIKLFTPKALLDKLDKSLDILKSAQLNRPARHQNLRETIEWSYTLLNENEKILFRRLSIFRGGASLEAVEQTYAADERELTNIVDDLMSLANKSLVQLEYNEFQGTRVVMLKTIRNYALELLRKSYEEDEIRMRHMHYFLNRAESIARHLTGSRASEWLNLLEVDLDNYRKAMIWTLNKGMLDLTFRMGISLWRLWYTRGMMTEAIQFANQLLETGKDEQFMEYRVQILETLGVAYFYTSEYIKAIPLFEESLTYWKKTNNPVKIATLLNHLGFTLINTGKSQEGIRLSQEADQIWKDLGDLRGQAISYNNLGWAKTFLGRPAEGIEHFTKSHSMRQSIEDERGEAFALINLAWALGYTTRKKDAFDCLEKGFNKLKVLNDRIVLSWGLFVKAQIEFESGMIEECTKSLTRAEGITSLSSIRHVDGWGKYLKGLLVCSEGKFDYANELIQKGIHIFDRNGNSFYLAKGWHHLSYIAFCAANDEEVLEKVKKSLAINCRIECQKGIAENLELAALALSRMEKCDFSTQLLLHSAKLRKDIQAPTPTILEKAVELAHKKNNTNLPPNSLKDLKQKSLTYDIDQLIQKLQKYGKKIAT